MRRCRAFAVGKWTAAADGLGMILGMVPDPQVLLKLGNLHYSLGYAYFNAAHYPEGIEAFRTFLKKFPNNPL